MSKSIVIVGGGSSGWMTAATLISHYPEYSITLVESPDIPTIGVGESTQQRILTWLKSIDANIDDFMVDTDASYKLSIRFKNFHRKKDEGFHYPFGKPYFGDAQFGWQDWFIKKTLSPETPVTDFAETYFPQMEIVNQNKYTLNRSKSVAEFDGDKDYALHFNATKFAGWLREKFSIPKGVKRIEATVSEVKTDDNGVSSLLLDNGQEISADLYIDCTGFKALLANAIGEVEFIDMSEKLPCNKAWAVQIPYKDVEKELENYTNCTALGYGWVWNTPLYSRIGTGYVYSDKFTTDEEALEEFKAHLCSDEMVVPRTPEDIKDLKFNQVRFKTGRMSEVWNKNVITIGLSAGFIEPLESNGLHTTHEYLITLLKLIDKDLNNQPTKDIFNAACKKIFDSFFPFVEIHYIYSERKDTEFWRYMTSRKFLESHTSEMAASFAGYISGFSPQNLGVSCVMVGHEVFPLNKTSLRLWDWTQDQDVHTVAAGFEFRSNKSKKEWKEAVSELPSHYQYLKKKFYSNAE
jgi:tryptophan halogenase